MTDPVTAYDRFKAALYWKRFLPALGIMLVGKLLWFAYWGILMEADSVAYLDSNSLLHPPGYFVFSILFTRILDTTFSDIILAQILLFSISWTAFLSVLLNEKKWFYLISILIAIDPLTGMLASELMSETLFLSACGLGLSWMALHRDQQKTMLYWLVTGILWGVTCWIRYSADIFLVGLIGFAILSEKGGLKQIRAVVLIFLGFQAMTLPLRFLSPGGTSLFRNLSLWNATAWMYPHSETSKHDATSLLLSLNQSPDPDFSKDYTWQTGHIYFGQLPFRTYVDQSDKNNCIHNNCEFRIADSLRNIAIQLILEKPGQYLSGFVLPNLVRPFHFVETTSVTEIHEYFKGVEEWKEPRTPLYHPYLWWIEFVLLLFLTIAGMKRKQGEFFWFLVISVWLNYLLISFFAVLFLRFLFYLMPFLVTALGLLYEPRKTSGNTEKTA